MEAEALFKFLLTGECKLLMGCKRNFLLNLNGT